MTKFKYIGTKEYVCREKSTYLLETDKYIIELEALLTFYEDCIIINVDQLANEEYFKQDWDKRYNAMDYEEEVDYIAQKINELINDKEEFKPYIQYYEHCFDIYFVSNRAGDLNSALQSYLDIVPIEYIWREDEAPK